MGDKVLTVIERGCDACHGTTVTLTRIGSTKYNQTTDLVENNWRVEKDGKYIDMSFKDMSFIRARASEFYYGED
jgi:hypothetical protein